MRKHLLNCGLCSFGNFPGVWSIKADVSELNVGSIVLGDQELLIKLKALFKIWRINRYEMRIKIFRFINSNDGSLPEHGGSKFGRNVVNHLSD